MKIKVGKDSFIKALNAVSGIINVRTTLPILSNVLLESNGHDRLVLTSTDMEIGISRSIEAQIDEEGSITVPAKKLLDIIRELSAENVELEVTKSSTVQINSGKSYIKLIGLPKDDFPVFPHFDDAGGFEIEKSMLQDCFKLTSFAISGDENKYVLNGILLKLKENHLEVVATDGRRLAFIKKEIKLKEEIDLEVIIPTKTIFEIQKLHEEEDEIIRVISLKNQVVFKFSNGFIISRLIEGHFPDYEKVIPKTFNLTTKVHRKAMLSVLRRAYLLTSKESQGIKLDFLKGKILISAKSPNLGELKEEMEIEQETEGITVGFNPVFLMDVLKNIEDEQVVFQISGPDKPGLIRKESKDYLCVIMPMQIS